MVRDKMGAGVRLLQAGLALAWAAPGAAFAAREWNLQPPVTPIARQMFDLHLFIFWICVVIFVAVFGVMFYSIFKHRKSVGHKAAQFHENTTVEIVWTVIPFLILIFMAFPATKTVLAMKDTSDARPDDQGHRLPVEVGLRLPARTASASTRNLTTPRAQIENREPKGEHYLLEVDNPLVVPVDKKVRMLITAGDVIHSWWVPAFGVKQDAIPGFVRDTWFKAEKVGIYRGQCAELCGKEHGFMPIVVEVKSEDDYAQVGRRRRRRSSAAAADDPNKVWDLAELVARGEKVYTANCAACHQATGKGVPPAFPALDGSKVVDGPKDAQIHDRAERRERDGKPTAMPSWKTAVRHRHRRGRSPTRATAGATTPAKHRAAGARSRAATASNAQRARFSRSIRTMSSIPHDHVAGHARPRPRPRRPRAPSRRDHALGHDDQPQGHRHAVPVVLVHDVPGRRHAGADDPRRAVPAGPADRQSGVLQPADDAARPDHGVRRDHAGGRRLRELADPADDRRARHGVRAHEQLELLAAAAGGDRC